LKPRKALPIISLFLTGLLVLGLIQILAGRACAAGVGGAQFQVFRDPPPAGDLKLAALDGGQFRLSDLKGKVVVLNFWRKDCTFCAQEKRHLKDMVKQVNRPDLKVVCVNFWDSPAWVRGNGEKGSRDLVYATRPDDRPVVMENTVRGRLLGYFVLNDARDAVYEVKGFPSTYVINAEGKVVATHLGMVDWTKPTIRQWIAGLMGPAGGAVPAVDENYELPGWLDGLLGGSRLRTTGLGAVPMRRAQAPVK